MLNFFLEPLSFEFMRRAITTAILLGILCAVVGTYLIVQRMGLLREVIAQLKSGDLNNDALKHRGLLIWFQIFLSLFINKFTCSKP